MLFILSLFSAFDSGSFFDRNSGNLWLTDQNIENQSRVNWKAAETMFLEFIDLYEKIGPKENKWNSNISLNGKTSRRNWLQAAFHIQRAN